MTALVVGGCSATTPEWELQSGRPVVLTSDADLASLMEAVETGQHAESWQLTVESAQRALKRDFVPMQLADHEDYFHYAIKDARAARDLALVGIATSDSELTNKAIDVLLAWARDAVDSGETPGRNALVGQGLVIGRVISVFADAYALVEPQLADDERSMIQAWLRLSWDQIMASRDFWETTTELCNSDGCGRVEAPWINGQVSNHLSAQNMGLLAIGYALGDRDRIQYAMDSAENDRDLHDMINDAILMSNKDAWVNDPTFTRGAPDVQPGELWDRLRIGDGRGLHYTHIQLRFLTIQALMAQNNGYPVDWFSYVGPDGESIEVAFEFYSEFLITGDPTVRGGYYSDDAIDGSMTPLYEIAHRAYPDNDAIAAVLSARDRVTFDPETFGWSVPLTHGN